MIKFTLAMPRLGETMHSGTIAGWNMAEGNSFQRGDTLLEVETDKTLVEYPALGSGRLVETLVAEGDMVDVGDPIAIIETEKNWPISGGQAEGTSQPTPDPTPDTVRPGHAVTNQDANTPKISSADGVRATPLARRIAKLGDVDLTTLPGTGRRHRIEATDVIATLKGASASKPAFLLLHGLGSNAISWSGLIASLKGQEGVQVSALDLPGHGDNPREASQIDDLIDYVTTHLRSLPRKVHLVGHSLGAYVAAQAASKVSNAISEVMLIAPAGCGPEINTDFLRGLASVKEISQLRGLLTLLGPKAAASPDAVVNAMLQDLSRSRLNALVEQLLDGASSRLDIQPALADIKDRMPVSAVIGTQDQILPKEHLFRLPSHVRIHILNAGHVPQWDAPAEIAALLQYRSRNAKRNN